MLPEERPGSFWGFRAQGYVGIALSGFLFMALGMMVAYIARVTDTDDMGKIILYSDNPRITNGIGYFMAAILYMVIISMSAAGGSFLHQQFGLHKAVGGGIIAVLVILTVLGNFDRISRIFRWIVPVLLFVDLALCAVVIFFGYRAERTDFWVSGKRYGFQLVYRGVSLYFVQYAGNDSHCWRGFD